MMKATSSERELLSILKKMDVPQGRDWLDSRERTRNMLWLMRNMGIRNSQHPDFHRAMAIIRELINA